MQIFRPIWNVQKKFLLGEKLLFYVQLKSHSSNNWLFQVIKEHLPSPKPSVSNRSSPGSQKSEPSRQLKLVPQEELLPAKSSMPHNLQVDNEASVQMEMRRVMQELVELNERRSHYNPGEAGASSSRLGGHLPATFGDPYQQLLQQARDDKQMDLFTMAQMSKAAEFRAQQTGTPNPFATIGFQEEFRRHLNSATRSSDSLFPPNLPTGNWVRVSVCLEPVALELAFVEW